MPTEATKTVEVAEISRRLFDLPAATTYLRELGAEGVTLNFVRGLVNSGAVPHLRIGRRFYVSRGALDHWLTSHERRR